MTRLLPTLTLAFLLTCAAICIAEDRTGKLLLLHTNDIHARLKPNDSGQGGLPYVAAYVKQVRQSRRDVLLLDAGDVLAKGNMVSWMTRGRVMYEAMNQIGYDAGVPGNHDFAYGADQLRANMRTASFPLLCANPTLPEVEMQSSAVFSVNGVRIGVIGLTLFSSSALEKSKALLGREAARLEQQTDLLIALCHLNSQTCLALADAVPEIDVFVSGHAHEVLRQPIVAKKSGARIVQAGSLARYVGRWELTVDLDSKKLIGCQGELASLPHDTNTCDEKMMAWITQQEKQVCPESERIVGTAERTIGGADLAKLFGQSLLHATDADLVLSHTSLLKDQVYPGPIDFDDLFVTYVAGQQREPVEVQLTGLQLNRILANAKQDKGTMIVVSRHTPLEIVEAETYRVVLMRGNWGTFQRRASLGLRQVETRPLDIDLIETLADYLLHRK